MFSAPFVSLPPPLAPAAATAVSCLFPDPSRQPSSTPAHVDRRCVALLQTAVAVASLWLGMLVPYKGSVSDAPISDITSSLNNAIAKTLSNVPHMPPSSPARP
jgi:hypothetical protein